MPILNPNFVPGFDLPWDNFTTDDNCKNQDTMKTVEIDDARTAVLEFTPFN